MVLIESLIEFIAQAHVDGLLVGVRVGVGVGVGAGLGLGLNLLTRVGPEAGLGDGVGSGYLTPLHPAPHHTARPMRTSGPSMCHLGVLGKCSPVSALLRIAW